LSFIFVVAVVVVVIFIVALLRPETALECQVYAQAYREFQVASPILLGFLSYKVPKFKTTTVNHKVQS
jgi:hypothetical protein